jgi:hypothetical protein
LENWAEIHLSNSRSSFCHLLPIISEELFQITSGFYDKPSWPIDRFRSHRSEPTKGTQNASTDTGTLGMSSALASSGEPRVSDLDGNAAERTGETRSPTVALSLDRPAAVAEEYDATRRKDTTEAYELFIARHGDDSFAEKTRAGLKRLSR